MAKAYLAAVLSFLCALFVPLFAQTQAPNNRGSRRSPDSRTDMSERSRIEPAAPVTFRGREIFVFKKRLSREQKKRLAPAAADQKRYELFLNQPKTGLIKLFPDLGCEETVSVIRVDEICLNAIPTSGFYSFREQEHTSNHLADIRLKNDVLITDGLFSQGILVALGDVQLETLTLASDGIKFLNDFKPESNSTEVVKQNRQFIKGVKSGEHLYGKAQRAMENMTYALRLIAYRGKIIQTFRGFPYDLLAGDERVDVTVAFRILGRDEAGGFTILWKELARKDAPKVIFPKRNKKSA